MKFIYESSYSDFTKENQMVIVIEKDRNGKEHFTICKTMEDAKQLFPSAEKRLATIKVPKNKLPEMD